MNAEISSQVKPIKHGGNDIALDWNWRKNGIQNDTTPQISLHYPRHLRLSTGRHIMTWLAVFFTACSCLCLSGCFYEIMSATSETADIYLEAQLEAEREKRKRDLENTAIELELRRIQAFETPANPTMSESEKQEWEKLAKLRLTAFFYANKKALGATDSQNQDISNKMVASDVPISVITTYLRGAISSARLSMSTKQRLLRELRLAITP